jgi:hypothetical protein
MVNTTNQIKTSWDNELPFAWSNDEGGKTKAKNDCNWLESSIENYAKFSDAWVKVRAIQLAYQSPPIPRNCDIKKTYAQCTCASEIVDKLKREFDDFVANELGTKCKSSNINFDVYKKVDEDFVDRAIASWKNKQFTQEIGRNFEIYADCDRSNVFLVTSTAPVSLNVKRELPDLKRFRPLFNVDELARLIHEGQFKNLTLRTHGFANPAASFYQSFAQEADTLNKDPAFHNSLYVGYHWPSEQPFLNGSLYSDVRTNSDALVKFLFVLSGMAGIVGLMVYLFLSLLAVPILQAIRIPEIWLWGDFNQVAKLAVQWYWLIPTTFLLWLMAFALLRVLVYHRDRYRAVHYGAPDLAEFFWRLDKSLANMLKVNLVGHSMGGLVLVNMLRVLSDKFGKDDLGDSLPDFTLDVNGDLREVELPDGSASSSGDKNPRLFGENLELIKIILASPDIPLEFLRESRNNYVRSAISRCDQVFLMSSDRDIVLRYLSAVINWFSEPSIEMSAARLGNVYLKKYPKLAGQPYSLRPNIRILVGLEPVVKPTSAYGLFQKFNYLDCAEMKAHGVGRGVNGISCRLNLFNGVAIDIANTLLYFLQPISKIDLHGGYFQTNTPSFSLLKLLISDIDSNQNNCRLSLHQRIEETIRVTESKIRYLPSHDWHMP